MYNQIAANTRKSFALVIVFMAIIASVGYALGATTDIGGPGALIFAFILSSVSVAVSYFAGDRVALIAAGAQPVSQVQNPYLYRMVENLCIVAGLPMPKLYIIEDPSLNAFATGRDPHHASIAVTRGLLQTLKNEELEGVISHELSHVKNYDIRFMMLVAVLVGTLLLMRDFVWRSMWHSGRSSRDDRRGGNALFIVVALVLSILAPLIAELIKLAISRRREYLADASGALLTRYPEGLALALEKISSSALPLQRANGATAHLFISSPFGSRAAQGLSRLFSTHPPAADRIRILREMTL